MDMASCHAENGRLGCDTILEITPTSLASSAMLDDSLAYVYKYMRHGCWAKVVSLLHVFQATAEPSRLALECFVLCNECQLGTGVGGRETATMALTSFPAMRLCAYRCTASTGTPPGT